MLICISQNFKFTKSIVLMMFIIWTQSFLTTLNVLGFIFYKELKTTFKLNTCTNYPHLLNISRHSPPHYTFICSIFCTYSIFLHHIYSIFPALFSLWSLQCNDGWKERCVTGLCAQACFAQLVFVPPGRAINRCLFLPVAPLLSDSPCSSEGPVRVGSFSLATRETTPAQLNLSHAAVKV